MKEFIIFVLAGTIFGTLGIFTTILRIHGFGFFAGKIKNKVINIIVKVSVFLYFWNQ